MFSIVILAGPDSGPLVATFRSLVSGVVAGVVSDVVVLTARPGPLADACDRVGARLTDDGEDALRGARGSWVILLEAGARPVEGWADAVLGHALASTKPAAFDVPPGRSLWRRLFGRAERPLRAGFVVRREDALSITRTAPLERLPAGRAAQRLSARLVPAEPPNGP